MIDKCEIKNMNYALVYQLSGFVSGFPLFNQVYIGINVSLIWALIPLLGVLAKPSRVDWRSTAVLLFLLIVFLKFVLAFNLEATFRYFCYISFFGSLVLFYGGRQLDWFFDGLQSAVYVNIVVALVQVCGLLTGSFDFHLSPEYWNPTLWHYNPPGGMFTFIPRVSGLTNEPAYLGLIAALPMAYKWCIQKSQISRGSFIVVSASIILLANSRTSTIAYFYLCGIMLIRDRSKVAPLVIARIAYVCSLAVLVGILLWQAEANYRLGGAYDYDAMMLDDISVFSRTAPVLLFREMNNLGIFDVLFGVGNYRSYIVSVSLPAMAYEALLQQGAFLDAKSLFGAVLFDFGVIGVCAYVALIYIILKNCVNGLFLFSFLNVAFFNIYAFSWPLFWIMFWASIKVAGGDVKKSSLRKVI